MLTFEFCIKKLKTNAKCELSTLNVCVSSKLHFLKVKRIWPYYRCRGAFLIAFSVHSFVCLEFYITNESNIS